MHFVLPQPSSKSKSAVEYSSLNLARTIKKRFEYNYSIPVAQGRMAELILAKMMVKNAMVVPNNMLFATTRLHQELNGAILEEIPAREAYDVTSDFPFKGNIDIEKLEALIKENGSFWIAYIYVETCVNASGGHPVSMENIKAAYRIAKKYGVSVILDACRIFENAYFIKQREKGYGRKSVSEIVREFCSYSDGCTMSATKDFSVDCGGFLAMNNKELYYQCQDARMVIGDGLSVRSQAILNDILNQTVVSEKLVRDRMEKVFYLWKQLKAFGLPVVHPCGGQGVFIDAKDLYEALPVRFYPEESFLAHLFISSGIRADSNILTPQQEKRGIKMLRLAIPIGMYSKEQIRYVAKSLRSAWEKRGEVKGLKKTYQPPSLGGAFFAQYEMVVNHQKVCPSTKGI